MATLLKHTVKPSGGDFDTLSAAAAHLLSAHSDLVSQDQYAEIEISGDWSGTPDTAMTLFDWSVAPITDATHYIHVYTDSANRARSAWDTSKYILGVSNDYVMKIYDNCVRIDGLQLSSPAQDADFRCGIFTAWQTGNNADIRLSNLLIKGPNSATYRFYGINLGDPLGTGKVYIWNTVVFGMSTGDSDAAIVDGSSTAGSKYIYNCVALGGVQGLLAASAGWVIKNSYFKGDTGYAIDGVSNCTLTSVATSDETGTIDNVAYDANNFKNVGAGTEDFDLAGTGSALYHAGSDTSGDSAPLNFGTDIHGDNYYSQRSIGVDEVIASGGATIEICVGEE